MRTWLLVGALAAFALACVTLWRPWTPSVGRDEAAARGAGSAGTCASEPGADRLRGRPPRPAHVTRSGSGPEPAPGRGPDDAFEGVVVDAEWTPVPGAYLQDWDEPESGIVTTGENGRFTIRARGRKYLRARAWTQSSASVNALDVLVAGRTNEIQLVRAPPIRVRVVSAATGAPVQGARVSSIYGVRATQDPLSSRRLLWTDRSVTDGEGRAEARAPEGRVYVHVAARGYPPAVTKPFDHAEDGASVEVALGAACSLVGTVVDPMGRPVPGAELHLVELRRVSLDARACTSESGMFEFEELPSGEPLVLGVRAHGWAPVAREIEALTPGPAAHVTVRLDAGRVLDGSVRFRDGRPVAGAEVRAQVVRAPWFDAEDGRAGAGYARTDGEGRFTLGHLPAARLEVCAELAARSFRAVARTAVPRTGAVPRLDLVERRRRGDASAHVRIVDGAGEPIPFAVLSAIALGEDSSDQDKVVCVVVNRNGYALLRELPAGRVRFVALVEQMPERAVEVTLAAGAEEEIELRMPGGEVEGRILLADGGPARVEVSLLYRASWADLVRSTSPVRTDASGRFGFSGLGDAVYAIELRRTDLRIIAGPRVVRLGSRPVWTVGSGRVESTAVLFELLDAATGEPLPGADVEIDLVEWVSCTEVAGRPGWYQCDGPLDPGQYAVRVRCQGALETVLDGVMLKGSVAPSRVLVELDRGAVLEGRVVGLDGRPIPGVWISPAEEDGEVETDAEGCFRLTGLPEGEVQIEVAGRYVRTMRRAWVSRTQPTWMRMEVELGGEIRFVTAAGVKPTSSAILRIKRVEDSEGEAEELKVPRWQWRSSAAGDGGGNVVDSLSAMAPGLYVMTAMWGDGTCSPAVPIVVRAGETVDVYVALP